MGGGATSGAGASIWGSNPGGSNEAGQSGGFDPFNNLWNPAGGFGSAAANGMGGAGGSGAQNTWGSFSPPPPPKPDEN